MNYIKIAAIVLCFASLFVLLTANGAAGITDAVPGGMGTAGTQPGDGDLQVSDIPGLVNPGVDTYAAMHALSPDTVMLSSGNYAVTWDFFYFVLHGIASQLTDGFMYEIDWYEENPMGGGTWADMVMEYVIDEASTSILFDYGIDALGVTMSDENREYYQSILDGMLEETESLEQLEEMLQADGFYSYEFYREALMNFALQNQLQYDLLEKLIAEISDEKVAEYAEREGFLRAKHILIMFPGELDGLTEEELEEAKQEAFSRATEIYEELEAIYLNEDAQDAPDNAFIDAFSEAVEIYSEDPGSIALPEGYLFRPPDMVPEFSAATMELEFGQMSGIVETSYGYHIILRLPLDFDNMSPIEYSNYGQFITLRQLAAYEEFENVLTQWENELNIVRSPQLESLDLGVLFAWNE